MSKKSKWLYRAKNRSRKAHNNWLPITDSERKRIEAQHPFKFEFKENKPPEPTPSMKKEKN